MTTTRPQLDSHGRPLREVEFAAFAAHPDGLECSSTIVVGARGWAWSEFGLPVLATDVANALVARCRYRGLR